MSRVTRHSLRVITFIINVSRRRSEGTCDQELRNSLLLSTVEKGLRCVSFSLAGLLPFRGTFNNVHWGMSPKLLGSSPACHQANSVLLNFSCRHSLIFGGNRMKRIRARSSTKRLFLGPADSCLNSEAAQQLQMEIK